MPLRNGNFTLCDARNEISHSVWLRKLSNNLNGLGLKCEWDQKVFSGIEAYLDGIGNEWHELISE